MRRACVLLVCLIGWARPSGAAVTFDARGATACIVNGAQTKTCTSLLTVGSGSNRALVCAITWSTNNPTAKSLTWDTGGTNQAMTVITNAGATNTVRVEIWGLVAPTSGLKSLLVSWTNNADMTVDCASWTGVDQTGGVTSFPHGTGSTGSSTAPAVTVTSASGNAVMDSVAVINTLSAPTQTQVYLTAANTQDGGSSRAAGAATVAFGWTNTATGVWADAGTDIQASGGATRGLFLNDMMSGSGVGGSFFRNPLTFAGLSMAVVILSVLSGFVVMQSGMAIRDAWDVITQRSEQARRQQRDAMLAQWAEESEAETSALVPIARKTQT